MNAKKIHLFLAVVLVSGMFLAGIASAAPNELWFFEVHFTGKGYETDTDAAPPPYPVYTETKHILDRTLLYAMYDREFRGLSLAFYDEVAGTWARSVITPPFLSETEKNVLAYTAGMIPVYIESIDGFSVPIYATGSMQIRFKEQSGIVNKARLKSISMAYWQTFDKAPVGQTQQYGALQMKGEKIDGSEVPPEVLSVFGVGP